MLVHFEQQVARQLADDVDQRLCGMPARRKVQSAADPRHPLAKHGNVVGRRGHGLAGEMASIAGRSEEHTSELQSLMRSSYAVFCLKKKKTTNRNTKHSDRQS